MREIASGSALINAKTLSREYLAISLPTLWRMRANGKLPPAIALSSQCLRWRRCDVESWIASGCPPANEQRLTAVDCGEASKDPASSCDAEGEVS